MIFWHIYMLCVRPTAGETLFESFQAIIAHILYADISGRETTPYVSLCERAGITLVASRTAPRSHPTDGPIIFYSPHTVTHYKVLTEHNIVLDPYKFYQAKGTQGFCQLFAYFLAIGDTDEFMEVGEQTETITNEQFYNLAYNNVVCARKFCDLFEGDAIFREMFCRSFNRDIIGNRAFFGLVGRVTCEMFIEHLKSLDIRDAMLYVFDHPLAGIEKIRGPNRQRLWDYIHEGDYIVISVSRE
jgi:hypothetical protein